MRPDPWQRLALLVAGVLLAAGVGTLLFGSTNTGIRISLGSNERLVVADVEPHGLAELEGFREGMVVIQLNGVDLVRLPEPIFFVDAEGAEVVLGWDPPRAEPIDVDPSVLGGLLDVPVREILATDAAELDATRSGDIGFQMLSNYGHWLYGDPSTAVLLGLIVLVGGGWLLMTGRAGAALRPLAVPLSAATAAPFLLQALPAVLSYAALVLHGLLLTAAMLVLAGALLGLVADERLRRTAALAVGAFAALGAMAAVAAANSPPGAWAPELIRLASLGATTLLPGLLAAGPSGPRSVAGPAEPGATGSGRVLQATDYAIAGATPLFAMLSVAGGFGAWPILALLAIVVLAGRITIRPLVQLATRAALQRDLVVAATEAERARVAADIHDDALQELTLLVRRLDAAGDTDSAELARGVAERLRAICGDLRLPILDDLGVGPALDWLVLRIERLAGGEVRLERADGTRPPPDVELAFFRVAQEALANAVKHGRPPIVVRYRTTEHGASLSVDDAGPGIAPGAVPDAERAGQFGLLNMSQRAEQIGAILDVRSWPGGGTHVALEWRPG